MLNPRAYAEDCMRHGLREMWHSGMPWQLVNDAIDANFNYKPPVDSVAAWEKATRKKWDNVDDPFIKALPPCLDCGTLNTVVWSTCGKAERDSSAEPSSFIGQGYGDINLETHCTNCGKVLTKAYLEVSKFITDAKNLLKNGYPMPGTILDGATGKPSKLPPSGLERDVFPLVFPNTLVRHCLQTQVLEPSPASMRDIREAIDKLLKNGGLAIHDENAKKRVARRLSRPTREAQVQVKKMMSRYLGNSSPFALELGGAVLRQGVFTEKMHKVGFLHPSMPALMS
jgi:hypothetical protein